MTSRKLFDSDFFTGWRPFDELESLRRQMDRALGGISGGLGRIVGTGVFPPLNVSEDKDRYYVRAELPGVDAKDLELTITGRNLAIAGERKQETLSKEVRYHRRERNGGKFSRVLALPDNVSGENIAASTKNGILTISVPKAEVAKTRKIAVK